MKHYAPVLNSGDINLTASLMSMGIPLDQDSPCSLIERDNGRNYASFHVEGRSIEGDYQTKELMHLWKNPHKCENLAFDTLMNFAKYGKEFGAVKTHEWLEAAFEFIQDMNSGREFPFPKNIKLIPDMVAANPDNLESYVMAFVFNRNECWQYVRAVRRRRYMISHNGNHAMIDNDLPQHQFNELKSRLED